MFVCCTDTGCCSLVVPCPQTCRPPNPFSCSISEPRATNMLACCLGCVDGAAERVWQLAGSKKSRVRKCSSRSWQHRHFSRGAWHHKPSHTPGSLLWSPAQPPQDQCLLKSNPDVTLADTRQKPACTTCNVRSLSAWVTLTYEKSWTAAGQPGDSGLHPAQKLQGQEPTVL